MEESQYNLYKNNTKLINRALNIFLQENIKSLSSQSKNNYYLADNNLFKSQNKNVLKFVNSEIRSEFHDLFIMELVEMSDDLSTLGENLMVCDELIDFTKELLLKLPS